MNLSVGSHRNAKQFLIFITLSAVFVISQAVFFQGFNGNDDLLYAFLATKMVQGNFSPFVLHELFTGRVLLIAFQAAVYAVAGAGLFTTQIATYAALIIAAYLTIFRLLNAQTPRLVLLASALFYFNPVVADITLGPAPDIFILLASVGLLLLLKKLHNTLPATTFLLTGVASGIFIFCTLLIKESGLVFLPFAFMYGLFFPKGKRLFFLIALVAAFITATALCGWVYYSSTGDFFFRVKQLQVAAYPNPCKYHSFFQKEMLIRLTYVVWEEFLRVNFLPVLLAVVAVAQTYFVTKKKSTDPEITRAFLLLLLVGLYFPFSVSNYQPLCFKARHFLFLLPTAVAISSAWLDKGYWQGKRGWYQNAIAAFLIGWSINISNNGWNWDFYRCLLALLILFPFLLNKKPAAAAPLLLAAILWLALPYRYIYERKTWFEHLKKLSHQLSGSYFYFPDHDNMMHWKLLHHFDTTLHYFNLDPKPFHVPNPYYESLQLRPGWFILNRQYLVRSPQYVAQVDSLLQTRAFSQKITSGPVIAAYLSSQQQFTWLQTIMQSEKQRNCNCGEEPNR